MDENIRMLANELLESGVKELTPREHRIIARIASRHHVTRNVNLALDEGTTLGQRMADGVAHWGGSWSFVIAFFVFLLVWSTMNTLLLAEPTRFDPYPFIFLNLLLSMLAAIQAPIIMMSQNRQAERDRLAASLDYEINLKAEMEILALHEKIDGLVARLGPVPAPAAP